MKINCDISKNYFNCFNESKGVVLVKNILLKHPKMKTVSYLTIVVINIIILFLLSLIGILINGFNGLFIYNLFNMLILSYIIINILYIINNLNYRKGKSYRSYIEIGKNGITDESYYGIKMIFSWDKVKAIVIKKHTVIILTDTPVYFYFDISQKNKIMKELTKYKNDFLIIEKTNRRI